MTQKLFATYRIINLLSIDVALGAICSALFFARLLEVNILSYGIISLGLSVWIIYTVDHLMDARKIKTTAATTRHQFHQQHFRMLSWITIVAVAVNVVIIFFVRKPVLIGGLVMAVFVGLYLLIHRYLNFLKEFFIAFLYTIGILLPSVSVTTLEWHAWPWAVIAQFFITALLNLILFSWFDYEKDKRDGHQSFVTVLGLRTSKIFIGVLLLLVVGLTADAASFGRIQVIILGMNLILFLICLFRHYFEANDRFRLVGDIVFCIPLLYLLP